MTSGKRTKLFSRRAELEPHARRQIRRRLSGIHRALALLGLIAMSASQLLHAGDPKELFDKVCAPCHSKDGTAQTPAAKKLGVKDLSQSKLTDAQIIQQILDGKLDPKSPSKMPPFKEKLAREEVESLVPVVKGFRKLGIRSSSRRQFVETRLGAQWDFRSIAAGGSLRLCVTVQPHAAYHESSIAETRFIPILRGSTNYF